MITEQQQEQAVLYALGVLGAEEESRFQNELRINHELVGLLRSLQQMVDRIALSAPVYQPPASLKNKLLLRIQAGQARGASVAPSQVEVLTKGLKFLAGTETSGWKQLP